MTWEIRRKYIQFLTVLLTNPEAANLCSGRIYKGGGKAFCAPGLNCYSCPAAALSCPVGALQAVGGQAGFSFYVSGFLLLIGVLWGRLVCGFLCPFGLMQELLHKLPCPRKKLYLPLRWVKYGILAVFVLLWPAASLLYGGGGRTGLLPVYLSGRNARRGCSLAACPSGVSAGGGRAFCMESFAAGVDYCRLHEYLPSVLQDALSFGGNLWPVESCLPVSAAGG